MLVPQKGIRIGILKFITNLFYKNNHIAQAQDNLSLGSIMYNEKTYPITVPNNVEQTYSLYISDLSVNGLFISSHRNLFIYREVKNISTRALSRKSIYNLYHEFMHHKELDEFYDRKLYSPTLLIKEALISLATFGYGNQAVDANIESQKLFEGYQEILKQVLPPSLGFKALKIEVPEVVLETETGDFTLDAVSGGIASIIELTWQIYMYDDPQAEFVVLLDEPENHLHPELQRTLLPNLIASFPNVQFIVATHNPFVISSVNQSQVYVLNYNKNSKVVSNKLDDISKSGTANDILREVLGIPTTIPLWADYKLQEIIQKYSQKDITKENISQLRKELEQIGLQNIVPEAIVKVFEEGDSK